MIAPSPEDPIRARRGGMGGFTISGSVLQIASKADEFVRISQIASRFVLRGLVILTP